MNRYYYTKKSKRDYKKLIKIVGGVFILCGIIVFGYFFLPVISWQVYLSSVFASSEVLYPVPQESAVTAKSLEDVRNWYPTVKGTVKNIRVPTYRLSIPKLNIDNAEVSTVDYDLTKHLIQYAGTANPGELGTAVVFGHSTLPQLFDSKNYRTIFATLHYIKEGDVIKVSILGKNLTYKVFAISILDPDDTGMFAQTYDSSYLTLVTCTPPGTVWKRLVVKSKRVS